MSEQTCLPDPRGRCTDPVPRVAPGEMTAGDREWLAAYDAFLAEPGLQGTPEAGQVTVERAELLMRYRRWDEAETTPARCQRAGARAGAGAAGRPAAGALDGGRRRRQTLGGPRRLVTVAVEVEAAGGPQVAQIGGAAARGAGAQAEGRRRSADDARCGAAFEVSTPTSARDIHAAAEAADGAGPLLRARRPDAEGDRLARAHGRRPTARTRGPPTRCSGWPACTSGS